jgi:hypothetical protein
MMNAVLRAGYNFGMMIQQNPQAGFTAKARYDLLAQPVISLSSAEEIA